MAVLSGKEGYITVNGSSMIEISKWDLEYGSNNEKFYSRNGGGASQTVAGALDGSGSFEVMYNDDTPITSALVPGTLYTAVFYHGTNDSHTGSLRIGKFSFSVDREGSAQRVSVTFDTHGVWTLQAS